MRRETRRFRAANRLRQPSPAAVAATWCAHFCLLLMLKNLNIFPVPFLSSINTHRDRRLRHQSRPQSADATPAGSGRVVSSFLRFPSSENFNIFALCVAILPFPRMFGVLSWECATLGAEPHYQRSVREMCDAMNTQVRVPGRRFSLF